MPRSYVSKDLRTEVSVHHLPPAVQSLHLPHDFVSMLSEHVLKSHREAHRGVALKARGGARAGWRQGAASG